MSTTIKPVACRMSKTQFLAWLYLQQLRRDAVGYFATWTFDRHPHRATKFMIVGDRNRMLVGCARALVEYERWATA
jgi:hypothetical protein